MLEFVFETGVLLYSRSCAVTLECHFLQGGNHFLLLILLTMLSAVSGILKDIGLEDSWLWTVLSSFTCGVMSVFSGFVGSSSVATPRPFLALCCTFMFVRERVVGMHKPQCRFEGMEVRRQFMEFSLAFHCVGPED